MVACGRAISSCLVYYTAVPVRVTIPRRIGSRRPIVYSRQRATYASQLVALLRLRPRSATESPFLFNRLHSVLKRARLRSLKELCAGSNSRLHNMHDSPVRKAAWRLIGNLLRGI